MVTGIEITTIQGLGGLILFIVFFILASNSTNQFAVLFRSKSLSIRYFSRISRSGDKFK